jgi:hypothetical protein
MKAGVSRGGRATFPGLRESYRLGIPNTGNLRLSKREMVPDKFINLLPPEITKGKVSGAVVQPAVKEWGPRGKAENLEKRRCEKEIERKSKPACFQKSKHMAPTSCAATKACHPPVCANS